MSDIIAFTGWTQQSRPRSQQSFQHLRSLSSSSTPLKKAPTTRQVSKSVSSSSLHTMATVTNAPGIPSPLSLGLYRDEDGNMTTLPDPRSRTMSPASESTPGSPTLHPDLNDEVATLSNKLINAINHQTTLDDTLSATRHELERAKERVKQLEKEAKEHAELLASGMLIKKSAADVEAAKLRASLADEKKQRTEIEKEKKHMETELENLTAALFEEANKMVVTAREEAQREHETLQRKNEQLRAQIADTENLVRSQQEQLTELKLVMEQMTEEREDQTNPTSPSTPGLSKYDSIERLDKEADGIHQTFTPDPLSLSYPTSFTHLLQTVLRTDLSQYDDFLTLLRASKNTPVGSRQGSGAYGNIGLGIGLGGYASSQSGHPNGSTTSVSTIGTSTTSPTTTPTTPASTLSSTSSNGPNVLMPLKDTKFYKRALAEDIEPTLRLDSAPGLSWLARRTVLNAVCEGSLIVEPIPSSAKNYNFACALCGENRKDATHARSHRFRTNENDNAQKYPLCKYCHGRVRSTCDFLNFLRILKDGHWRCEDEEGEKAAWEESVRLREQMFWCRIGGGVVPVHQNHSDMVRSPRISEDERKEQAGKLSVESDRSVPEQPAPVEETPEPAKEPELPEEPEEVGEEDITEAFMGGRQKKNTNKQVPAASAGADSATSLPVPSAEAEKGVEEPEKRLSLNIPRSDE